MTPLTSRVSMTRFLLILWAVGAMAYATRHLHVPELRFTLFVTTLVVLLLGSQALSGILHHETFMMSPACKPFSPLENTIIE